MHTYRKQWRRHLHNLIVWFLLVLGSLVLLQQGLACAKSSLTQKELPLGLPSLDSPQTLRPGQEPRKFSIRKSGKIACESFNG